MKIKIPSLVLLLLFSLTILSNAAQLNNKDFLHLEEDKNIEQQIKEYSNLVGKYYYGSNITEIKKPEDKVKKIYNPCEIGLCGLNILKEKYYIVDEIMEFAGKKYSSFFELSDEKVKKVYLVRKIQRKEYSLPKNRKDTIFDFMNKRSNLLKEEKNAYYSLEHCYNGERYLGGSNYGNVVNMNNACNELFTRNIKKSTYKIEKQYKEMFYVENKTGMNKSRLNELTAQREIKFPYKRGLRTAIVCSMFNYCVEFIEIENKYAEFFEKNFMVYEDEVLVKELELLEIVKEEKEKIHCNNDHMEEGISKEELSDRIICAKRMDIFRRNALYALKINKYNEQHVNFSNNIKYRNFNQKIKNLENLINDDMIKYTQHDKKSLKMELNEYKYLLSLIKIYEPEINYNLYKRQTNEEIFNSEYDIEELNAQIKYAKKELERYKQEKVQYLIDKEYTRIYELERVKAIKF